MFHFQTNVNGFMPQRVHGQRGRAVTHGLSDFRGVEPGGEAIRVLDVGRAPGASTSAASASSARSQGLPITEDGEVFAIDLPSVRGAASGTGSRTRCATARSASTCSALIMQARGRAAALEPRRPRPRPCATCSGCPVPRITYTTHAFERSAAALLRPVHEAGARERRRDRRLRDAVRRAARRSAHRRATSWARCAWAPTRRRPWSTRSGRFHDVDNLYACDGSVFPTSSGYNPTLTIIAVALRIAHGIAKA